MPGVPPHRDISDSRIIERLARIGIVGIACESFYIVFFFAHIFCLIIVTDRKILCESMDKPRMYRTASIATLLPKLVEAGLSGNRQRLELLSLNAIRALRSEFPEVAGELGTLLSNFAGNSAALRWHTSEPPPSDSDTGTALMRIQTTDTALEPILEPWLHEAVARFVRERTESRRLLQEGFAPARTLLLKGRPGTGKTMLAGWLARILGMPFVTLDLATSISSYLGKTGSNLRRSLDYARATPCVLLLDEFDAIAKRRDDSSDLGELKRIVNVLLKELEDWPIHSVLVAATNHSELLDPAIHRRFDVVLEVPLPTQCEREAILERACGHFATLVDKRFVSAIAAALEGNSGSDVDSLAQAVVRRHIVEQQPLERCFVGELKSRTPHGIGKKDLAQIAQHLHQATDLSVREIADLVGKSSSTVQYHLSKEDKQNARS